MDGKSKNILSRSVITETQVVKTTPDSTIKLVKVQSLVDAHVYYTGRESGRPYEWNNAGAIVNVDESDVPELLAKRSGKKPCCGGERTKIFQLAD
jgi:hypothetical protein